MASSTTLPLIRKQLRYDCSIFRWILCSVRCVDILPLKTTSYWPDYHDQADCPRKPTNVSPFHHGECRFCACTVKLLIQAQQMVLTINAALFPVIGSIPDAVEASLVAVSPFDAADVAKIALLQVQVSASNSRLVGVNLRKCAGRAASNFYF